MHGSAQIPGFWIGLIIVTGAALAFGVLPVGLHQTPRPSGDQGEHHDMGHGEGDHCRGPGSHSWAWRTCRIARNTELSFGDAQIVEVRDEGHGKPWPSPFGLWLEVALVPGA